MIENDQDYISKEVRSSRKKKINKSTKYYEETEDNVDNVDNQDNINDEDYYTNNDYNSEEHVKPKTKTILQSKTKKNKGKQTFSKKRYY